jgi:type II secretory pathway component GspD/PulD (secretin)
MKKIKLFATVLLAGFVLHQNASSQPNATETNQPPDASPATNGDVYADMVSNVMTMSAGGAAATVASNETVTATEASNVMVAPVASNDTAKVEETNLPAATGTETDNNSTPVGTTETNNPVVSEIRFQDIPITSAIENLARQAGINYLLDPKIGYGQPDQNGQIKPEPSLSLRWENITPEQALLAVLDNYGLQLITDPRTKIAKITIKDPTAPIPLTTHVYQLAYASVSNMVINVSTALTDKRSKVVPDERTSQLIVVATDQEQTDVATLIERLDKPTRQVLIETRLIEISSNPTTSKGVDWTGTLQAQNISFGNGVLSADSASKTTIPGVPVTTTVGTHTFTTIPTSTTTTTLASQPQSSDNPGGFMYNTLTGITPAIGFLNADGVKATLSFLNESSDAQVVSTPRIVTLDNQQATISVTRAFPIFATTAGTQGSPGGSSVTYSNVGIILQVTPHISANDYIWMKVLPQVTSFYATVTKTIAGEINQADEFDSRVIDTQVLIPNANTLVMGGMVKDNPTAAYTKVPFLGDIPILGLAFRSETKSMDKQNLLIFITPTIVTTNDFQPTATDFMNSRPIKEQEPLDPNSAWESGKPRDWSDPKNTDPTQAIINQKTTD